MSIPGESDRHVYSLARTHTHTHTHTHTPLTGQSGEERRRESGGRGGEGDRSERGGREGTERGVGISHIPGCFAGV